MSKRVTIGLCVRNAEATIKDTVRSIIDQHFPHELMELIVVDDGSRDQTLSIISDYVSQTKIKMKVYHNYGKGLGIARQTVLDNASGEYIIWIDGDMTISRNHVQKQVEFMEKNPKTGKARGHWENYKGKKWVAFLESLQKMDHGNKSVNTEVSKLTGIGASIFRVKTLKHVGGFDKNITGAGEDIDIAARIRAAGWLLSTSDTSFYHKFRETWKELWDQYFWYGYGGHYVLHKNPSAFPLWHRIPSIAFMIGLWRSIRSYKTVRQKLLFLMPFECFYKNVAWCLGFYKGHINGYGPSKERR